MYHDLKADVFRIDQNWNKAIHLLYKKKKKKYKL